MKILLIPDSFKGTLSSMQICALLRAAALRFFPNAEVVALPVADGGEGSVDAFLTAVGGERRTVTVKGPFYEDQPAFYGLIDGGRTAVIEMAACAGLPLVEGRADPSRTTTYGVGQLIEDALLQGAKKLLLAFGGSATNDMGCGMAAALGVRFLDREGQAFLPVGGTLDQIKNIDTSGLLPALAGVDIEAMCDIDNPLYGENGAAYIFAPQKGADAAMVEALDGQLRAGAATVRRTLGLDLADLPGAGAAGGLGYGAAAFLGAKLRSGIEVVLDTVHFQERLQGADYVLTGEGRLDSQSLRGKVVVGVARAAKPSGVPVIALVGDIADDIDKVYDEGVAAVFSTNRVAVDFSKARLRAASDLSQTAENLFRFLSLPRIIRKDV